MVAAAGLNDFSKFGKQDAKILKKLNSPQKAQDYVDTLKYEYGKRISPLNVLKEKRADCLEAAVFACAALKFHKIENFLIDLRATRDEDHVLCVFKIGEKYGSIAQSKFVGLRGRQPVYSSVKELVMSYFDHFFNFFGELTLREFSVPLNLDKKYKNWLTDDKILLKIEDDLDPIKHFRILDDKTRLPLVNREKFWREILIVPKQMRVGKRYKRD